MISDPRLARYLELISEWAPRLDLVADRELERLDQRHLSDSLRLHPLIAEAPPGPGIDVGSGAGFPGVPLAISDSERLWRLLEPRQKRAAFLEEVVRQLELTNCEVVVKTAQEAASDPGLARSHAIATARALAPPGIALTLLRPLVAPGGVCLLLVGEGAEVPGEAESPEPGVVRLKIPPSQEGSGA